MKYNQTDLQITKEITAPFTTKETKIFSYGYVDKGEFIVESTRREVAYYYDTAAAIKDAISRSDIDELNRLFNVTDHKRYKKRIFHAIVAIHTATAI